jgi:heme-degrading monooxygenase HmoA
MFAKVAEQPGFLGMEAQHTGDGKGVTVCYWQSLEAIAAWRADAEHVLIQEQGKSVWYSDYRVRVCKIERDYGPS